MAFRRRGVHILKGRPKTLVRLGVLLLQRALLINRRYRDPGMYLPDQFAMRVVAEPVRKLAKPLMQRRPEGHPISNRRRHRNRPQARDVLMAHFAVDAARLDQTALQATACLSKADEHVV